MRWLRFLRRRLEKSSPGFFCPVCHLPLSMHDIDADGYTVCPVCSVVLQVVVSGGTPLPVVHDMEIKRAQPRKRAHAMYTHFSIGLVPVSLLFGIIALILELTGSGSSPEWAQISRLILFVSLAASVMTFGSGYFDWWTRYRHRQYSQITLKVRLSLLLLVLGTGAVVASGMVCGALLSVPYLTYLVFLMAMLGVMGILGHIGGNLVFGK